MNVKEVAELAGVSVRTLHHYDDIGILKPDHVTDAGYRQYSMKNLQTLQHILFFKELGFPLKHIREMLQNPNFDPLEALQLQRKSLLAKREQFDKMLTTIEHTIQHLKGEREMTLQEKFDGLQWDNNPYEQEARERWGNDAVDSSKQKLQKLDDAAKAQLSQQWETIFKALADQIQEPVDSKQTIALMEQWYNMLNNNFGKYSYDAFIGLGQLYTLDERFTNNINKYGEGLAEYLCEAMAYWGNMKKNSQNS